ncbi:hypothetical protein QCA50_005786 [Cerrena zonata]|uniref:Uncharacterized protein n=1 Tax=Cerrena zonata TaxID=2478898 RepID=A0AAW0GL82_9APHY
MCKSHKMVSNPPMPCDRILDRRFAVDCSNIHKPHPRICELPMFKPLNGPPITGAKRASLEDLERRVSIDCTVAPRPFVCDHPIFLPPTDGPQIAGAKRAVEELERRLAIDCTATPRPFVCDHPIFLPPLPNGLRISGA